MHGDRHVEPGMLVQFFTSYICVGVINEYAIDTPEGEYSATLVITTLAARSRARVSPNGEYATFEAIADCTN